MSDPYQTAPMFDGNVLFATTDPKVAKALGDAYEAGIREGTRRAIRVCEDRRDHFKRMAKSDAATTRDEDFAHEAGECVEALKTRSKDR